MNHFLTKYITENDITLIVVFGLGYSVFPNNFAFQDITPNFPIIEGM